MEFTFIAVMLTIAGVSGVAGYWGRIAKKLEDRRDDIYLNDLPAVYSCIVSFKNAINLFRDGGAIEKLEKSLNDTLVLLKGKLNTGNILLFESELHQAVSSLQQEIGVFCATAESINNIQDVTEKDRYTTNFRSSFQRDEDFTFQDLSVNSHALLGKIDSLEKTINGSFKKYHSYSWRLTIIIFGLGAFVALIEILKGLIG